MIRAARVRRLLTAAVLVWLFPGTLLPDQEPPPVTGSDRPSVSATRSEVVTQDEMLLTGDVDLRYGDFRLLADQVRYNDATRVAQAEGNVVLSFGKSQISGDRLEINVDTRLATVWNAHGYMDPDVVFQAARLERVSEDTVVISDATVTTCTQPTPYWSFHVSSARLQLDSYAHMRGVSLRVSRVPVIYTPYLIWPMKQDRATGLLLPNVGYSRRRGSFIGNAFYVVMGRSQDTTLYYDRYGRTGTGIGFEYRFVPAPRGEGSLLGYYVEDDVKDPTGETAEEVRKRYRFKLTESQRFDNGFRLLAELNTVSDLDYYLDFERDITQTTSPTVFSHVDLTRNWSNYALNVRLDRQEQFLSDAEDVTLQRLPEMELRGRGIRFGRSPIYLSFEASAGVFDRERNFAVDRIPDPNLPAVQVAARTESVWQRYDLFPTISASFSPTAWLDVSPSVSGRRTYYTRRLVVPNDQESGTEERGLSRDFASFNLSVVGPRLFRLFGDAQDLEGTTFKHTFEPRVVYTYTPEVHGAEDVIRFDELDITPASVHKITYSLTSRLFAKHGAAQGVEPSAADAEPYASGVTGRTQVQAPVAEVKDLPDEMKDAIKEQRRAPGVGAVEVATFDVSQDYSFDDAQPISTSLGDRLDGTLDPDTSQVGPVVGTARLNPSSAASLDLRASYDILFHDVRSVSLSANLRSLLRGYVRLSWFLNRDLEGRLERIDAVDPNSPLERRSADQSQIRLIGGTSFLQRKITLDVEGSYDIEQHDLRDQRYRLGYNTQCCGVLMEVARRDFRTIDEIEYRFVLNLRGVGTFLDLQGRPR